MSVGSCAQLLDEAASAPQLEWRGTFWTVLHCCSLFLTVALFIIIWYLRKARYMQARSALLLLAGALLAIAYDIWAICISTLEYVSCGVTLFFPMVLLIMSVCAPLLRSIRLLLVFRTSRRRREAGCIQTLDTSPLSRSMRTMMATSSMRGGKTKENREADGVAAAATDDEERGIEMNVLHGRPAPPLDAASGAGVDAVDGVDGPSATRRLTCLSNASTRSASHAERSLSEPRLLLIFVILLAALFAGWIGFMVGTAAGRVLYDSFGYNAPTDEMCECVAAQHLLRRISAVIMWCFAIAYFVFALLLRGLHDAFNVADELRCLAVLTGLVAVPHGILSVLPINIQLPSVRFVYAALNYAYMNGSCIVVLLFSLLQARRTRAFLRESESSGNYSGGTGARAGAAAAAAATAATAATFPLFMYRLDLRQAFREHLENEFSVENMMFVEAVADFKTAGVEALQHLSYARTLALRTLGGEIVSEFFERGAPNELNLPAPVVKEVLVAFASDPAAACLPLSAQPFREASDSPPTLSVDTEHLSVLLSPRTATGGDAYPCIFDRALASVMHSMRVDSFRRFMRTERFAECAARLAKISADAKLFDKMATRFHDTSAQTGGTPHSDISV